MSKPNVDITPVLVFLNGAKDAAVQTERHNLRAQRMFDACTRVTSSNSGMPGGGSSTREDKLVLYCDACTAELDALWQEQQRRVEIAAFLDLIPRQTEKWILQLRYLDYMPWRDVLSTLETLRIYYTERHIRKLHKHALEIAAVIYEDWRKER